MNRTELHEELTGSVHRVRGSLTDLIASVGGDPRKPQDVSRRFGVDKSLAWKISRIIKSPDPGAALPHVPGEAALDIFLQAMQRAGAAQDSLNRARQAISDFHRVVQHHVGDRPTLELVLDALPSRASDRLALSRKLAFRGNSGIWGVQARVRVNTIFLAPNRSEPHMIDCLSIGGWVDFRRLRPDAQWTLFRRRAYRGNDSLTPQGIPLDPDDNPHGPMLLKDFCSSGLPPILATEEDGAVLYELGPSPVGNTGAFSCFYGSLSRKLGSRLRQKPEDRAEFHAMISAPVQTLMFDMIVHHSLSFALDPTLRVYGQVASDFWAREKRHVLPIAADQHQLGARPPEVSTPLVREYSRLVEHAFSRAGWDARDFVGKRFQIEYPPFPSTVVVSAPLEPAPSENAAEGDSRLNRG
ncbi:MAG: hypothetical protein NZ561_13195 [Phycisphaerae bacterium]|nr:hypothetical protein [Phycisphaerae bacterium]